MLFALEAILGIAYQSGSQPLQSLKTSRRQKILRRYLKQSLQHLVHNKILKSVRSARAEKDSKTVVAILHDFTGRHLSTALFDSLS